MSESPFGRRPNARIFQKKKKNTSLSIYLQGRAKFTKMTTTTPTKIKVNTCPTAGWVMGNRKPLEEQIKKDFGDDVEIEHNVGAIFFCSIEIGDQKQRQCLPKYFCCPAFISRRIFAEEFETTSKNALAMLPPDTADMEH